MHITHCTLRHRTRKQRAVWKIFRDSDINKITSVSLCLVLEYIILSRNILKGLKSKTNNPYWTRFLTPFFKFFLYLRPLIDKQGLYPSMICSFNLSKGKDDRKQNNYNKNSSIYKDIERIHCDKMISPVYYKTVVSDCCT